MGEFLIIVPAPGKEARAREGFSAGLELARDLKSQVPNRTIEEDAFLVATFPRLNQSGQPVVVDMETGNWLVASGCWFHAQGYGSGEEIRLLNRLRQVSPQELGRELEGFFVIVCGDAKSGQVSVITDLIGSCHAWRRDTDWGTALSSSPLVLAALGDVSPDTVAMQEFLYTGVIYEDRSFFREIRKLPPASVIHFSGGSATQPQRYWCFEDIEPGSLRDETAVEQLGTALTRAAARIGEVYSRPVCDLTGGYDSRATVCGFVSAGVDFASAVSGAPEDADVRISKELAELIGVQNLHSLPLGDLTFSQIREALPYTDGHYELAEYYRILSIHRNLSQQFDISINGSFGEIGRGYWWELLFPHRGSTTTLDATRVARLRYAAAAHDASVFEAEQRLEAASHFAAVIERTNQPVRHLPNTAQMDHAYLMMRMQCWQGRIASSTNRIWPCLSPFMFRSVLEPMLASTVKLRRNGLLIRKMLVRLQPELAAWPLEHGHPAMPLRLSNVHRFLPLVNHYGQRIRRKLAGKLGLSSRKSSPDGLNQRLKLWQEEEVQACLDPGNMQLAAIAGEEGLQGFLENARQPEFAFDAQFLRTLTLEHTLQRLRQAGVRID